MHYFTKMIFKRKLSISKVDDIIVIVQDGEVINFCNPYQNEEIFTNKKTNLSKR